MSTGAEGDEARPNDEGGAGGDKHGEESSELVTWELQYLLRLRDAKGRATWSSPLQSSDSFLIRLHFRIKPHDTCLQHLKYLILLCEVWSMKLIAFHFFYYKKL